MLRRKDEVLHAKYIAKMVKFPKGVMMFGTLTAEGLGSLQSVPNKINADVNIRIFVENLVPNAAHYFQNSDYIFQKDGAPPHRAKKTKVYLDGMGGRCPGLAW